MFIQFKLLELRPLLGNTIPYAQIYQQLYPVAQRAGLLMPNREEGAGYLQWSLPGEDWTSLSDADEELKATVAGVYNERRTKLADTFKNMKMRDALLAVPSEKQILFRRNGNDWDIAMVAWGYCYPNHPPVGDLKGYAPPQKIRQQVNIGFMWDGELLPHFDFLLDNLQRQTGDDGYFRTDAPLVVGSSYEIVYAGQTLWLLTVEKGKEDYVRDLTCRTDVVVFVTEDGQPVAGEECILGYNGKEMSAFIDEEGRATVSFALLCDAKGQPLAEQPPCQVKCRDAVQTKAPSVHDDTLEFVFNFISVTKKPYVAPAVEEKEKEADGGEVLPPPLEELVHLRLLDYGGYPMPDLEFTVHTKKKGDVALKTDADGHYAIPKDWLEPGEKVKVRMSISDDYQKNHDLHDPKKSKKKKNKS